MSEKEYNKYMKDVQSGRLQKKLEKEKQRFLVILYSESNEYDMKWAQLYESIFVKAKQMIPISELIKSE